MRPVQRRKKLKVAVRRSRAAYERQAFAETLVRWARRGLFVGSAAGVAWGVHWGWRSVSLWPITSVTCEGPALPGWDRAPAVKTGQPLFSFSARRLERRLMERYPQVEDVSVRRGWDRSVAVRWRTRTPVAQVSTAQGAMGIDAGGARFPLGAEASVPWVVLPTENDSAEEAVAFLRSLKDTREPWTESLYKLKMSADGDATLCLANGGCVQWGEAAVDPERAAAKARRLQRVLESPEAAGGIDGARFVDDRRIVIKPRAPGTVDGKRMAHGKK